MDYVIIGNSAAAVGAVESIRKVDREGSIVIIGEENHHVYSRPLIAHLVAGEVDEGAMNYRPLNFYDEFGVKTLLGQRAVSVDFERQQVVLEDGRQIPYDRLLICTGSKVTTPSIKGSELTGVTAFQNYEQARQIVQWLQSGRKRAVVIGAGLIGLRAAYGLREAGAEVTIIEFLPRILSRVLDAEGSAMVEELLRREGVAVYTSRSVQEITGSGGWVNGVVLDDGTRLECEIVVLATGVAPNTDLVKGTPIKVNRGIVVNEFFQTTLSNVYAAGDVAETHDIPRNAPWVNANWPNAHEQGRIAGMNMAGERVPYAGSMGMNAVSVGRVPIVSLGVFDPEAENYGKCDIKIRKNPSEFIYQKLVFKDNRLKGAIFIGDLGFCGAVKELIRDQSLVGIIKDAILEEKYQLYGFLRKKRQEKVEGKNIQWKETYTLQTPYVKKFDEESWTERERGERKW